MINSAGFLGRNLRVGVVAGALALVLALAPLIAAPLPPTLKTSDNSEMVLIPAGAFLMGTHEGAPEEGPPHQQVLPAFYMDRTEVTVAQYAAFLAATKHPAPPGWTNAQPPAGSERLPITNIRWTDALRYAQWAGKRLPTEAEWEKAARGPAGRRFPWGNADAEPLRNKDTSKLRPVGSYPAGASLYGSLDMSGNAWEWTADSFEAYPGTAARSPHYGPHYRVVRGGGGEYLYGIPNPGTTTQRARLVPYGAHDFIGFRCVKDPPGQQPPYNLEARLKEAHALLNASLNKPRPLAHEQEFAALNTTGKIPVRIAGAKGQSGMVTMGFPLPRSRIKDGAQVQLLDADSKPRPLAFEPLARWPDGSLRWLLLRFPASSDEVVTVQLGQPGGNSMPSSTPLRLRTNQNALVLNTGKLTADLDRTSILRNINVNGQSALGNLELAMTLLENGRRKPLRAGPAESFEVESQSDLHCDLRWRGRLMDEGSIASPMAYDLRLRAEAGSPQLRGWLTVVHAAVRQPPWEDLKPQVTVAEWSLGFKVPKLVTNWMVGIENSALTLTNQTAFELRQPDDLAYQITADGKNLAQGTRSPGWLAAVNGGTTVGFGISDFWQNHPKGLFVRNQLMGVDLWSGDSPLVWEAGLAKTHEFVLELSPASTNGPRLSPLLGIPATAWLCGTEAAGALLPRDAGALRQLGYWETWREASMQQWVNAMPTGLRDYGDAYMGGPYKGKNAYLNLEYDVPLNFLQQYLRTGERWYLDAAGAMTRHQADVDTDNVSGLAWKHSPSHTTTEAEFGHVFLRGLLLHHLLTGDRRDREIAERLGDRIADALVRNRGIGNERQIGWSLYALSALHEVTGKPHYLEGARALCSRLAREQFPNGKFNIRWDNRIAFFNGIAASGMLSINEQAPDPAVEQAVLRMADRTLGMYPEYACRTLNAWGWVIAQTGDPRFVHHLERTWISSLEFLMDREISTAETHSWRFPSFAVRYNLFPQLTNHLADLPQPEGWQGLRFKNREVELFLKPRGPGAIPLVVAREGLARGAAELFDANGRTLARQNFDDSNRLIQSEALRAPGDASWLRLRLSSPDAFGWQVQHDRRLAVTVADAKTAQLAFLLPRAVGALKEGTNEVKLRLEVMGEGFHSATLFNPQGAPVARVKQFVDFEDPGRYELELKATVSGPRTGWSLELNNVKVLSADGFQPYWSSRAIDWFNPEQFLPGE